MLLETFYLHITQIYIYNRIWVDEDSDCAKIVTYLDLEGDIIKQKRPRIIQTFYDFPIIIPIID